VAYGTGESAPILPDGLTIEAKDGPIGSGAGDAHGKLVGLCNYEQSKAVQGETLTTEAGQSGSYKLGDIHADSKHEVTVGDALGTASDIRSDVFVSAIELNAYELARALGEPPDELIYELPRCDFRTDRETSPKERAETINLLSDRGLKISIGQLRREYGLDTPTSDDDVLPGKPIPIAAGGAVTGTADAATGVENPKEPDSAAPAEQAREASP
jgi:phage gp29-like protein